MQVTQELIGVRYRLEHRIGAGGMGDVWRAHDEHLDRPVAVKILRDELAGTPQAAERMRREARTAAGLQHPNVVTVYDVIGGGAPALIMELVLGETLAQRLGRAGALGLEPSLAVAHALLGALDAAHRLGIVHRDVKPSNVLLGEGGVVKVADFGVARSLDASATRITDTGAVVGTAHYLAPEQLRDDEPTPAGDQYAAALVIYECLTGRRPFSGNGVPAEALARLHVDPLPVHDVAPSIPEPVATAVMVALARDPAPPHPSVAAFLDRLAGPGRVPPPTVQDLSTPGDATLVTSSPPLDATTRLPGAEPDARPSPPRRRPSPAWLLVGLLAGFAAALLWQLPRGGTGGDLAAVPSVVGLPALEAVAALDAAGLEAEVVTVDSDRAEGEVVSQQVPAGIEIADASRVGIEVSTGTPPCCTVPALVGLDRSRAVAAAQAAGLVVERVEGLESGARPDTVIVQDPDPGERAEPGSGIVLGVAAEADERSDRRGRNDD